MCLDVRDFGFGPDKCSGVLRQRGVPTCAGHQGGQAIVPELQLAERRLSHGRVSEIDRQISGAELLLRLFAGKKAMQAYYRAQSEAFDLRPDVALVPELPAYIQTELLPLADPRQRFKHGPHTPVPVKIAEDHEPIGGGRHAIAHRPPRAVRRLAGSRIRQVQSGRGTGGRFMEIFEGPATVRNSSKRVTRGFSCQREVLLHGLDADSACTERLGALAALLAIPALHGIPVGGALLPLAD